MSDQWQFEKKQCECCDNLLTVSSGHYLFDDEGKKLDIPNLLNFFLNIEISKEDNEDAAICETCLENLLHYQKGIREENETQNNGKELPNANSNLIENHINVENLQLNHNANLPNDNTNLVRNHTNLKHKPLFNECYNGLILEYENVDDLNNDAFYDNLIEEDYNVSDNDEDDNNEKVTNHSDNNVIKIYHNDENVDNEKISNDCAIKIYETSFIDSIHKMNIKKRLIYGIPCHSVKLIYEDNANTDDKDSEPNIFVTTEENIYTFEYLMENFEDDCNRYYSNGIFDFDRYFASIINVSYDDLQSFPSTVFCALCKSIGQESKNIKELHNHTFKCHTQKGTHFMCILDHLCGSFDSVKALNNHLFVMHTNVIRPKISLTCKTCNENFSAAVQFGKHVCFIDPLMLADTNAKTFRCRICLRMFFSHKRFVFHQQFHLPSCRPKVCIICEQLFIVDIQYYEHVQFTHELIAEYSCKLCDKSYSNETEMIGHYHLNHTINIFSKEQNVFSNEQNLFNNEQSVFCNEQNLFSNEQSLNEDKPTKYKGNITENDSISCANCTKIFSTSFSLKRHNCSVKKQQRTKSNNVTKESNPFKRKRKREEYDEHDKHESVRKQQRSKTNDVTKEFRSSQRKKRTKEYDKKDEHESVRKELQQTKTNNVTKEFRSIQRNRRTEEYDKHIHVIWKNDYQEFSCHTCDKCYTTKRAARIHIRVKHLKESSSNLRERRSEEYDTHDSISCANCKKRFSTNFSLKRHNCSLRKQQRTKSNNVTKESRSFKRKRRREEHDGYDKHESVRKEQQRTKTNNVTKESSSILRERRAEEYDEDDSISCADCKKIFSTNFELKRHNCSVRKQQPTKSNNVTKESRSFKRKRRREEYDGHNKHESVRKEQQRTKTINVTKESSSILKERRSEEYDKHIHVIWKNDCQEFSCHTCDTCYTTRRAAQVHIRVKHLKERDFTCDVCDKSFSQKQDIILHFATVHTKERKFPCEYCPYKAKEGRRLNVHVTSHLHNSIKKIQCKHCFMFFLKDVLQAHKAMKHISHLFQCSLCKMGYKTLRMAKYCCKNKPYKST